MPGTVSLLLLFAERRPKRQPQLSQDKRRHPVLNGIEKARQMARVADRVPQHRYEVVVPDIVMVVHTDAKRAAELRPGYRWEKRREERGGGERGRVRASLGAKWDEVRRTTEGVGDVTGGGGRALGREGMKESRRRVLCRSNIWVWLALIQLN